MPDLQTNDKPEQAQAPAQAPTQKKTAPRKSSKKKLVKRIIALVVALAILAGIVFGMWYLVFREDVELGEIYAEPAFRGSIQSSVQGSGYATAKDNATITVPYDGVIDQLLVGPNETVYAGQPLFAMSSPAAEAAVEKARQDLADAQDGVVKAQQGVIDAEKNVPKVEKGIAAAEKQVTEAEKQVTVAEKQIPAAEKEVAAAEKRVTEAEKQVTVAEKQIPAAEKEVTKAEKRVTEAEKQIPAAEKEVAAAEKRVTEAEKQVTVAEKEVTKAEKRVTEAEKQVTKAEKQVTEAENQVTEAENEVTKAEKRVTEAEKRVVKAQEGVAKAKENVVNAKENVVKAQEGVAKAQETVYAREQDLADLQLRTSWLTITAPFSGRITEVRGHAVGDKLLAGNSLATLVNDKKLRVTLYFSYAYEDQIQAGQSAQISIPAMMLTTTGKVETINKINHISPEGGTYFQAALVFDNPGTLTKDMSATATLTAKDGTPIYPYESGKTEYYEIREIMTSLDGPLTSIYLAEDLDVTAGQTLAVLGPDDLNEKIEAAKQAIADAKEGVTAAQKEVTAAQEGVAAAEEGVETAEAGVEAAKEDVETAKKGVETAKKGVEAAQEGVEAAKEGVETAKEGVETAKEGVTAAQENVLTVKEGIAVAQEGVETAKEGVETAKEGVEAAKEGVEKAKEGVTAAQENVLNVKEGVETAKEGVTAAQEGVVAAQENVLDVQEGVTAAHEAVEDARRQVGVAEEGVIEAQKRVAEAEEALAKAQEDVGKLNATAPIDGTIMSCTIEEGSEVKGGSAVITISNTTTMVVTIQVDSRNIGFISLGSTIELSDWYGNVYMGTVTNIDYNAAAGGDSMGGMGGMGGSSSGFPVTLEVDNYSGALFSGYELSYSFVTSQSEDCILVQTIAVKSVADTEGNRQTVVFVERPERPDNAIDLDYSTLTGVPTPEEGYWPVLVETGLSDAKQVEIKSGIEEMDNVFISYTDPNRANGGMGGIMYG